MKFRALLVNHIRVQGGAELSNRTDWMFMFIDANIEFAVVVNCILFIIRLIPDFLEVPLGFC